MPMDKWKWNERVIVLAKHYIDKPFFNLFVFTLFFYSG